MSGRIPLTLLPLELLRLKLVEQAPSYRTTYNAVVDSRIPAKRGDNGRWTVAPADLPLIAATLCRPRAVSV